MRRFPQLRIERLAPTGEGVARADGRVVFVEGSLPEELVEAEIFEDHKRFARAWTRQVLHPSPDRRPTGSHEVRCGGTGWAHMELSAARRARRQLFLETMERVGHFKAEDFGPLPISESSLEYRLRNQFHFERKNGCVRGGFFERRSHDVVPLDGCEIVSAQTRAAVSRWCHALEDLLPENRQVRIQTVETVQTGAGFEIAAAAPPSVLRLLEAPAAVTVRAGGADFHVSAGSFFQVNRWRLDPFLATVKEMAVGAGVGSCLEVFAGSGFLSRALLDAGCHVTSVESSPRSCADALTNRRLWGVSKAWVYHSTSLERYLRSDSAMFDFVVADPPRSGLGACATALARRARRGVLYISCDPATLARDLAAILPLGFRIERAGLEDFFPLTPRLESFVFLLAT